MKIQLASDLHLEFFEHRFPDFRCIEPAPEAEALVLAGDIHLHTRALKAFADWPVPVLYVGGNHEAYNTHLYGLLDQMRHLSYRTRVKFLEMNEHLQGSVRFLGATLWTDYALYGQVSQAMDAAKRGMYDHRLIRTSKGLFTPKDALERHQATRTWLRAMLQVPFEGTTVVVTHHGPHPKSVAPQFEGSVLNPAFCSDMSDLMEHVDVWCFGHSHFSADFQVGRCRVLANPRGYALNRADAATPADLLWENPGFNPTLVIDV